ncbi:MAG TPA: DeoR/GlpR family DNA-binding transcription regulator [Tepidisphaeraceae bacterium]|nr:DeoR/GlpR family DNA-binding transcription regulator [Tepidisphaeraceae bacterium]
MSSTGTQRRERILAELLQHRHATARELADAVEASEATVRRDLKTLADTGRVQLVYGGATIRRASDFSFQSKATRHIEAKRIIGHLAAELVADEDQLFLDSGTTSFAVANHLKRKHGLSIIVNSARLALELDAPGLSVILLGGQYRADRMDVVGPLTMSAIDQLRGYVCMVGADGLSIDFGLAAADIESASLYRRAVQNARSTILLADHSKFLAPSLYKIVDWHAISRVVTDRQPDESWSEFFSSRGIPVTCPAQSPAHAEELTNA